MIENRDTLFDEIMLKLGEYQKRTIDNHNKNRKDKPKFRKGDIIYNKISGIPNKRRNKFKKQVVKQNRKKTILDTRNIKLHKSKLKRKRKL